ncbi:hypothetical protein D3C80_761820 [compost metagenome]
MAQHHWLAQHIGADRTVSVIVHVAAADADSIDLDLHVAWPNLQRKIDLPQRQLAFLLQYKSLHFVFLPYCPEPPGRRFGRPGHGVFIPASTTITVQKQLCDWA